MCFLKDESWFIYFWELGGGFVFDELFFNYCVFDIFKI